MSRVEDDYWRDIFRDVPSAFWLDPYLWEPKREKRVAKPQEQRVEPAKVVSDMYNRYPQIMHDLQMQEEAKTRLEISKEEIRAFEQPAYKKPEQVPYKKEEEQMVYVVNRQPKYKCEVCDGTSHTMNGLFDSIDASGKPIVKARLFCHACNRNTEGVKV